MREFFPLVSREFEMRRAQMRQFIRHHGPSIGVANELLLRDFLAAYLPKWFGVGTGFIMSEDGQLSRQIDIIVYKSQLYAPLYSIRDFVVLPPEAIVVAIEVKTVVNQTTLHDALANIASAIRVAPEAFGSIFVFDPPKLKTISRYLDSFDYSEMMPREFPENIYGLGRFAIRSSLIALGERFGQGFVDHTPELGSGSTDRVFERFFYDLYTRCEIALNDDLRRGVPSGIRIEGNTGVALGRQKYSSARSSKFDLVSFPATSRTEKRPPWYPTADEPESG